jgi:hypothetical protein
MDLGLRRVGFDAEGWVLWGVLGDHQQGSCI